MHNPHYCTPTSRKSNHSQSNHSSAVNHQSTADGRSRPCYAAPTKLKIWRAVAPRQARLPAYTVMLLCFAPHRSLPVILSFCQSVSSGRPSEIPSVSPLHKQNCIVGEFGPANPKPHLCTRAYVLCQREMTSPKSDPIGLVWSSLLVSSDGE